MLQGTIENGVPEIQDDFPRMLEITDEIQSNQIEAYLVKQRVLSRVMASERYQAPPRTPREADAVTSKASSHAPAGPRHSNLALVSARARSSFPPRRAHHATPCVLSSAPTLYKTRIGRRYSVESHPRCSRPSHSNHSAH